MAFLLSKVDEDALRQVEIIIPGTSGDSNILPSSEPSSNGVQLNYQTLQFPPIITKDSKSAEWMEVPSGSFEPMKFYVQSKSREIGFEFQWVCGGRFPPDRVHNIISAMKSYFYGPYFASSKSKQDYPAVIVNKFYGIIESRTTWRMMNLDVKYGKEMCKINNIFYPLSVSVNISLESATRLGTPSDRGGDGNTPFQNFENLESTVSFRWM